MSKGKYAVRASNARLVSSDREIEQVRKELAQARAQASTYKADARGLQAATKELSRLREQVVNETSDILDRERYEHLTAIEAYEDRLARIGSALERALARDDTIFSQGEVDDLKAGLGWEPGIHRASNRSERRAHLTTGKVAEAMRRLPAGGLKQLGVERAGSLLRVSPQRPSGDANEDDQQ